jgi:enterochelin esterase-like enzyme/outer membrane protein assembly factor BamB
MRRWPVRFALFVFLVLGSAVIPAVQADPGWPGLRGPSFDGSVRDAVLFDAGAAGLAVGWKHSLGSGYSGVAVGGGRVVTMATSGEDDVLAAFDIASGEEQWRYRISEAYRGHDGSHDGPISTPLMTGGRVYGLGAWGHLFAVDAVTGKEIWSTHLVDDHGSEKPYYGFTTSPLLTDGVLVVEIGAGEGKAIAGFDPDDGKVLWTVGDDHIEYHSPIVATIGGERQVIAAGAKTLIGLEAATGKTLWSYEHQGDERAMGGMAIIPLPAGENRLLILNKVDSSTMLDISRNDDGVYAIEEVWTRNSVKSTYVIPVYHDGYIYGMSGRIFVCVDADTGELKWRSREPGDGFPTVIGDHLVIITKPGTLHVADATPEGYKELARLELFEDHSWAEVAFADGHLFARSMASVARIDPGMIETAAGETAAAAEARAITGSGFAEFLTEVEAADDKNAVIEAFLAGQESFPIIEETGAVHFVYRGEAEDVGIVGDMIGFRREDPMIRIAGTDMYYYSSRLEPDAAVTYGFIVDYEDPVADPMNPKGSDGLFGEVSWLAMPAWQAPDHLGEAELSRQGTLESIEWESEVREEPQTRKAEVYLPAGYDAAADRRYPVIYVHGGKRALEDGNFKNALDQLIGSRIEPVIAVFVLPPGEEDRGDFYPYEKYTEMIASELVPLVDENYPTIRGPMGRANVGAASAGDVALFATLSKPELFARVGIQSSMLELVDIESLIGSAEDQPVVIYMDWGTYHIRSPHEAWDRAEESRKIWAKLREAGYRPAGGEIPVGVSWECWSAQTDDLLTAVFPLR